LAQQIKDQAVIDAEAQKQEILEEVRKQAEDEKAVILKDLRNLRYKVSKAVKDGRK
jgi:vacuolar-type H+-ATPase subunit H